MKLKNDIDTDEILSNQTRELIDKYKQSDAPNPEILSIFDKVSLMTPENIHVNAFMYEPLIDMSVMHLIILYNDIKCHMADWYLFVNHFCKLVDHYISNLCSIHRSPAAILAGKYECQ